MSELKIDHYFDVGCSRCARQRSTDFEMGMDSVSPAHLRANAKAEGWSTDKETGLPLCPICGKRKSAQKVPIFQSR